MVPASAFRKANVSNNKLSSGKEIRYVDCDITVVDSENDKIDDGIVCTTKAMKQRVMFKLFGYVQVKISVSESTYHKDSLRCSLVKRISHSTFVKGLKFAKDNITNENRKMNVSDMLKEVLIYKREKSNDSANIGGLIGDNMYSQSKDNLYDMMDRFRKLSVSTLD